MQVHKQNTLQSDKFLVTCAYTTNGRNLDPMARILIYVCVSCCWIVSKLWGTQQKSLTFRHSLTAGGATAAAGSGVPDTLFKRRGRWRSDLEMAKDGYVKDSVEG